ncbi:glycoside hydrolase family 9 protein [Ideonella sp. YS5]|uniref:glycoside hydrolase family 9 protein n=1 Tax=Ideonella sp. YS5 TaxID=3453714 RepID=UPI003EECF343
MKNWLSPLLLALCASAHAQSCGSGGGTEVCLSSSTTANGQVQLSWTVAGSAVSRIEVYRDIDPNPNGRVRIAVPPVGTLAYTDDSATVGTSYWYWIKFFNAAGSFNSGASAVMSGSACVPSTVTPYLNLNGTNSWSAKASASLNAGSRVLLGPQPITGNWSWSGCDTSGTSREQTLKLSGSCTATAVYTNSCGARTPQAYTFTVWPAPTANTAKFIMVDQFGYLPTMKKVAVLRYPRVGYDAGQYYQPGRLQVVNSATGAVVLDNLSAQPWKNGQIDQLANDGGWSGDQAWTVDFSQITAPGTYELVDVASNQRSARFEIGDNIYRNVLIQAVRMFYYQRAGQDKNAAQAGAGWADVASHLKAGQDTQARRWYDKNNAGTSRNMRGGWFDAGDYNKYTPWTASYVQELLDAYIQYPSAWTDDFNLPESGNGVPDLLDEVKWGMDWLVRMQNPDGSVQSILGIGHASPPSAATDPSYYGEPNTVSALGAAAAFAHGAKVYSGLNSMAMKAYGADLLDRARRAWAWAEQNPRTIFVNNDASVGTQGLGSGKQDSEDDGARREGKLVAAIKLFGATGEDVYRQYVDAHYQEAPMFSQWYVSGFNAGITRNLLYYAGQPTATASVRDAIRSRFLDMWGRADYDGWGAIESERSPYRARMGQYTWGSTGAIAGSGTLFTEESYYGISRHTPDQVSNAAADYLHYLHGVNPLGKVYLTNMTSFGAENSVNEIFHTWFFHGNAKWGSVATSTYGPPPGFLTGGPNYGQWDWDERCPGVDSLCGDARPTPPYGQPPQKSYKDFNDGWPLNSWPISEPSNGYQVNYIRLLARFVK